MAIYALQSLAGGFLDEDLKHFNKEFDEWCVQFGTFEEAKKILESLKIKDQLKIVEITPLSYPKYFFPALKGTTTYVTREYNGKIVCVFEPYMGSSFRIAICDPKTKEVKILSTKYKSSYSAESAFKNLSFDLK